MPLIAPDNGGALSDAGLHVLPFQNPANFIATPQSVLAQGQATNQLQQLSDQLALEKAERAADLAKANYNTVVLQHLSDPQNLAAMGSADLTNYLSKVAANRTSIADAGNALTQATAFGTGGGPTAAGRAMATNAGNAYLTSLANAGLAPFNTPLQQAYGANLTAAGTTLGGYGQVMSLTPPASASPVEGAAAAAQSAKPDTPNAFSFPTTLLGNQPQPATTTVASPAQAPASAGGTPTSLANASPSPSATGQPFTLSSISPEMGDLMRLNILKNFTTPVTTQVLDPKTGLTHQVVNHVAPDGTVMSSTDMGITKAENAYAVRTAAKDLENLGSAAKQAVTVQQAFDDWNKAYPQSSGIWGMVKSIAEGKNSRLAQGLAASESSKPESGLTSTLEKGLGGIMESPKTAKLVTASQQLGQMLSVMDQTSAKQLSGVFPSTGDLVNPEIFSTKLKGAQNAIAARIATYRENNVSSMFNPEGGGSVAGEAETGGAPAPGQVMYLKGQKGTIQTINGAQYFVPSP